MELTKIYNRLMTGDPTIEESDKKEMVEFVQGILNRGIISNLEIDPCIWIIKISNILYNNAANANLPLDDPLYDGLLVLMRKQNIQYPVGAPPVIFRDIFNPQILEAKGVNNGPKQVVAIVENKDKMHYFQELTRNQFPVPGDFQINTNAENIGRKIRNVSHNYDMCGTLEKCKYVLNQDAKVEGMYNDPSVQIFERDFIWPHIQQGIVDPNNISLIVSLKYDGISVEGTVQGDELVYACTRGDMSTNEASDLTPALGGMKFPRASMVDKTEQFGIKFELIINRKMQNRLAYEFGKTYVNPRNAVIGLVGGLDARKFRDYLTPVPLESSLPNLPRRLELEFLNKHYSRGIDMRFTTLQGTLVEVLYKLKCFVNEADSLRAYMDFQYDGVVVEYEDPNIRAALGKKGSIPNYSIAIKFPPMRRKSTFTHYTYSVGYTGAITPMAHFLPVEFIGAIHDKTTIHSYRRFKDLKLRPGDKVDLSLNNDVIVYLTRSPDEEQDPNNHNPLEEFPTRCPSCGSNLIISESGETASCPNLLCPERMIMRMGNLLQKLSVKDFSVETIRAIGVTNLKQLFDYPKHKMIEILGDVLGAKFYERIQELKTTPYPDYRVMAAIGFPGIGLETWKKILGQFPLKTIAEGTDTAIEEIQRIKGIGTKYVDIIKFYRRSLMPDIVAAIYGMNIQYTYNTGDYNKPKVRFTGFRDAELARLFNEKGFDASEGGCTKDTSILVIPHMGFESGNVQKAFKFLGQAAALIMGLLKPVTVNYENLDQILTLTNIQPYIMTSQQAYEYIKNFKGVAL